jgi:naphthoate synthase
MAYADILYEVKDQVAWLTINRPDRGNTFRRQTVLEMIGALNEARHDPEVRVIVLTGAGDRFFCLGGEKEATDGLLHYRNTPPVVDLYTLIDMLPLPVIAMVNGFAVGGGNVLANMCDLTIASETATFRQVGPMMGSYDAGFGTWYLEDAVGRKRAREVWYLNRKYTAQEARELGLVNWVVPAAELRARTEEVCEELKARGPLALAALKAAFHARHNGATGLSRVTIDNLVQHYYHTEEAKELGRSFNAKEKPDPRKFLR